MRFNIMCFNIMCFKIMCFKIMYFIQMCLNQINQAKHINTNYTIHCNVVLLDDGDDNR